MHVCLPSSVVNVLLKNKISIFPPLHSAVIMTVTIHALIGCNYFISLYVINYIATVLPRIMARVFISFQQFLTRPQNETDDYYWKKHVLFVTCDASDEL